MAEKQSLWHRIVNYRPDFLIVLIVIAVVAAIIVPVRGEAADCLLYTSDAADE